MRRAVWVSGRAWARWVSRQSQQDDHWLGSYRRLAVGILLLIMVATLARSYLVQREEALAVSLTLLGSNLPSVHKGCMGSGSISGVPPCCMPMGSPGSLMSGAGHWVPVQ